MRITNTGPAPRYFSYIGRSLPPGVTSPEISLGIALESLIWTDHDAGRVSIRLSDTDKALLARLRAADAKPVQLQPVAVAKQAAVKPVKPVKPARSTVPSIPMNDPSVPAGMPDFGTAVIPEITAGAAQTPSLAELKASNKALRQQKVREISQFMGSRV